MKTKSVHGAWTEFTACELAYCPEAEDNVISLSLRYRDSGDESHLIFTIEDMHKLLLAGASAFGQLQERIRDGTARSTSGNTR